MKHIVHLLLLILVVCGCKRPPDKKNTPEAYYVKCKVDGKPVEILSESGSIMVADIGIGSARPHHNFSGISGPIYISLDFVEANYGNSSYSGGTYEITRLDYCNGAAFGSHGNNGVQYETKCAPPETGTMTVTYDRNGKVATGTFSFLAEEVNTGTGNPLKTINVTEGTFRVFWDPH